MDAIESHVRSIIACALDPAPEDVRPECHLLAGIVSYERLRNRPVHRGRLWHAVSPRCTRMLGERCRCR